MAHQCHEVEYKLISDDMQDCIASKAKMGGVSNLHHHCWQRIQLGHS